MPLSKVNGLPRLALAAAVVLSASAGIAHRVTAQQHIETSSFNQAPMRPKDDPKLVARGKDLYAKQCQSCHAADLRGTEAQSNTGPNILRSQLALTDHEGDQLIPAILGQAEDMDDHKIPVTKDEAAAIAAYVRSVLSEIGSQGRPPGEAQRSPAILLGNAAAGKQYFATKCASCHSAEGDLKGFGGKLTNPKMLQSAWLRGNHFGVAVPPVTATVTRTGKPVLKGEVIHVDDFILTLKIADGSLVSVRRDGSLPRVDIKDPLEAHRNLLPAYTDKDIHDVTAYLVTLK